MIKSFFQKVQQTDLLNEASLQGNPAIPGEGGKSGSYLADVEAEVARRNEDFQRRYGRDIPKFMSYVQEVRAMQKNHEKELEALAEKAIRLFYGDILGDTKLNIRFPKSSEIKNMAEKVPVEPSQEALEALKDEDLISKIHARKIQNNITQGEAKNVKLILNLEEVANGFTEIFGRELGNKYKDTLNKITEIAGFFDWHIPMEVQKEMWTRNKSGFSGSVQISWTEPEGEDSEDLAQKLVDELIESPDLPKEEAEELFDQIEPTITAIGTDFAMLIHETVKGIYDLITSAAIPDDPAEAETVLMNTDTLADELEDLRYGPEMAGDLRDFLNQFSEMDQVPNFREKVFGKMVLLSKEDPKKFLDIICNILQENEIAKSQVQNFVDEVVQEWKDYTKTKTEYDLEEEPLGNEPDEEVDVDYESLSKKEIQQLIDQALEDRDFIKVRELSKYLKESEQHKLYERVIKINGYSG